jgi:hypothetical protein
VCDAQLDPQMTSGEIRQGDVFVHIESCALKSELTPSSFWYVYRIENRGAKGLSFRLDELRINYPAANPLPPGQSIYSETSSDLPPSTIDTVISFGERSRYPFRIRVPNRKSNTL